MIQKLKDLEKINLSCLLKNKEIWQSLDIDYHPPRVERVWAQHGDCRIYLHLIQPCSRGEALYHAHPWESAVHVLPMGGIYEHAIGTHIYNGGGITDVTTLCTQEVKGEMYYEMMSPDSYHYVRPIGAPVLTIMLSGPNIWTNNDVKSSRKLYPLEEQRKEDLLKIFQDYFE